MKKYFTGSTLKILAIVSMLIDHIGQVILKNGIMLHAPYSAFTDKEFSVIITLSELFHIIGRVAFPIFCFLLVEGFLHTRNLKKYMWNLGVFAVISEPVYDLAFKGRLISIEAQNVLFTLLLGLIILVIIRKYHNHILPMFVVTLVGAILADKYMLDGKYYGIILIVAFYFFHDKKLLKYIIVIFIMFVCGLDFALKRLLDPYFLTSVFSLIPIILYNGKRGIKMKYFFYAFYPVHLLLLFIVTKLWIIPLF